MSTADEILEEEQAFDPASRRLCPDETCIGLIGPDGRCKVCGAVSPEGPPPASAAGDEPRPAAPPAAPAPAAAVPSDDEAFDPDSRVLCSDDTCTGLVGPDGRCKVCGKPAA